MKTQPSQKSMQVSKASDLCASVSCLVPCQISVTGDGEVFLHSHGQHIIRSYLPAVKHSHLRCPFLVGKS